MALASLLAGFVDAIVGGGGLILVPALFAILPTTHPATLFGINKSASIWGTGIATVQYSRRVGGHGACARLPAQAAAVRAPGRAVYFLVFLVRCLGHDFLHASASAKPINTATNLAALALANVAGSLLGTRLALRHGASFVRGCSCW